MPRSLGPLMEMARIQSEINRLFDNLLDLGGKEEVGSWMPHADIIERGYDWYRGLGEDVGEWAGKGGEEQPEDKKPKKAPPKRDIYEEPSPYALPSRARTPPGPRPSAAICQRFSSSSSMHEKPFSRRKPSP